jgi:hypothetical protein
VSSALAHQGVHFNVGRLLTVLHTPTVRKHTLSPRLQARSSKPHKLFSSKDTLGHRGSRDFVSGIQLHVGV